MGCLTILREGGPVDREPPAGRSEAEMFAIAFACCREMLFRLSDQFSTVKRPDDGSAVNR